MSFVVPELRLFIAEERAREQREREKRRQRKPVIPEERDDRANAKEEGREMKRRPGGAVRTVAVLVTTILLALAGAGGGAAQQPMNGADQEVIDAFLAQAQRAAADGTAVGADIFASARDDCRTAFEVEFAARRDGIIEADDGLGPKKTIMPPPDPPGVVTFAALPRRGPAHYQLDRIATCLRTLSWSLGTQQLFNLVNLEILRGLEAELRAVRRELAELKRER